MYICGGILSLQSSITIGYETAIMRVSVCWLLHAIIELLIVKIPFVFDVVINVKQKLGEVGYLF